MAKIIIQSISFMILIATVVKLLLYRKRVGRLPRAGVNLLSLSVHLVIFYLFVMLANAGIFDLLAVLNDLFGVDYLTYHLWSSAIRLQTVIEIFIMASSLRERITWIGV